MSRKEKKRLKRESMRAPSGDTATAKAEAATQAEPTPQPAKTPSAKRPAEPQRPAKPQRKAARPTVDPFAATTPPAEDLPDKLEEGSGTTVIVAVVVVVVVALLVAAYFAFRPEEQETVRLPAAPPIERVETPETSPDPQPEAAEPAPEPVDVDTLLNDAARTYRTGAYGRSADFARRVLEAEPDNATAHLRLGRALTRLRDADNALIHAERALELDPREVRHYLLLGDVHLRFGRPRRARAVFQRCRRELPSARACELRLRDH